MRSALPRMIAYGDADAMVAGGTEKLQPLWGWWFRREHCLPVTMNHKKLAVVLGQRP